MANYARLARAAYNTGKYSEDYDKQGYIIDTQLSDKDRTVFFHPGSKRAVVSFRGTKLNNFSDLLTDVAIARGREGTTSRFMDSLKTAEKVARKYGKDNVSLTGHSLGGSQAIVVGQKLGLHTHAFNPGVGPLTGFKQTLGKVFKKSKHSNVNVYHTGAKDIISVLSPMMRANVKRLAPRFHKDAHSIDNFIF
jgi:hypothetical protein